MYGALGFLWPDLVISPVYTLGVTFCTEKMQSVVESFAFMPPISIRFIIIHESPGERLVF